MHRLTITLSDLDALRLRELAGRAETSESELAGCLLSSALDGAAAADGLPPLAILLDGIPGAFGRTELGREQARRGLGTRLEDL